MTPFHVVVSAAGDFKTDSDLVTFTTPPSTARPANGPSQNSSTKNAIQMAWHGVEQLLQKVERCLGGTPLKAPVGALNVIIEVINVYSGFSLYLAVLDSQFPRQL